jgi:hypothetical protein
MGNNQNIAYIIRPFGTKDTSWGKRIDFDSVHRELISPALYRAGLKEAFVSGFFYQGEVRADLLQALLGANMVIADISIDHADTFYSLGIRHALRKEGSIFIQAQRPITFGLQESRLPILTYDPDIPFDSVDNLSKLIESANEVPSPAFDSPVFRIIPSLTDEDPSSYYSVFISHSSADSRFAMLLAEKLGEASIHCWIDEHHLKPGDKITHAIDEAIRTWDKLILVCSQNSLTSPWVERELDRALNKEHGLINKHGAGLSIVIPLDVDGFVHSAECLSPYRTDILARKVADFTNWEEPDSFDRALGVLVDALRADAAEDVTIPRPKL